MIDPWADVAVPILGGFPAVLPGSGETIAVLKVDASRRPDLLEAIVRAGLEPDCTTDAGAATTAWFYRLPDVVLDVQLQRPVHCHFALRVEIPLHAGFVRTALEDCLVGVVLDGHARALMLRVLDCPELASAVGLAPAV